MAICPTPMELLKQAGGDTTLGFVTDIDCRGRTCWFCSQPIEAADDPAVYWAAETTIHLHAMCAERFGAHILKDGLVARLAAENAATTQIQGL